MISTIFAAIKVQLEKVLSDAGGPIPSHELGAWHIDEHDAPPRIVWEVIGGPVVPPRQAGADGRGLGLKQIGTRQERCRIHIWDKDFTTTEVLMNHFVAAARACMTGFSFRALSTNWLIAQNESTALGRLCILEIEISIPFTAEQVAISHPPHPVTINGAFHPEA